MQARHILIVDDEQAIVKALGVRLEAAGHKIIQALRETGNKTRAAVQLGIPRQSLQKMMKRLELSEEDLKS